MIKSKKLYAMIIFSLGCHLFTVVFITVHAYLYLEHKYIFVLHVGRESAKFCVTKSETSVEKLKRYINESAILREVQ